MGKRIIYGNTLGQCNTGLIFKIGGSFGGFGGQGFGALVVASRVKSHQNIITAVIYFRANILELGGRAGGQNVSVFYSFFYLSTAFLSIYAVFVLDDYRIKISTRLGLDVLNIGYFFGNQVAKRLGDIVIYFAGIINNIAAVDHAVGYIYWRKTFALK